MPLRLPGSGSSEAVRRGRLQIFQFLKVLAASFTKIAQRVHCVPVHHLLQFGESLIGRKIGVNDRTSHLVGVSTIVAGDSARIMLIIA